MLVGSKQKYEQVGIQKIRKITLKTRIISNIQQKELNKTKN